MPTQDDSSIQTSQEVYRKRKNSFIASNDLELDQVYHTERDNVPHMYPGNVAEVRYLNNNERNTTTRRLQNGVTNDTSLKSLGPDTDIRNNQNVMFTRRGSVSDLMMMEKTTQQRNGDVPLKTNHSSMNQGRSVANAGFLNFGGNGHLQSVDLESGHYTPGNTSGVKLAMWADKTGAFNSANVPIRDMDGHNIDTSRPRRVIAVNQWADNHPKVPNRGRRNSI